MIGSIFWLLYDSGGIDWDSLIYFVSPVSSFVVGIALWFVAPLLSAMAAPFSVPFIANAGGPKILLAVIANLFALWLTFTGAEQIVLGLSYYTLDRMEYSTIDLSIDTTNYPVYFFTGIFRMVFGIFFLGWLLKRKELAQ